MNIFVNYNAVLMTGEVIIEGVYPDILLSLVTSILRLDI